MREVSVSHPFWRLSAQQKGMVITMNRVIIFGVGEQFRKLFPDNEMYYEWIRKNDIFIVGVASKNPDKLGQYVSIFDSTYEIKSIGDFTKDSYDYILVTTTNHFEKIRKFLVGQGISEDKAITFDEIMLKTFKYGISIAAIVKDEVEYIEEWIQFHILMGVEHCGSSSIYLWV